MYHINTKSLRLHNKENNSCLHHYFSHTLLTSYFMLHHNKPYIGCSECMFCVFPPQAVPGGRVQRQTLRAVGHPDWDSSPGDG